MRSFEELMAEKQGQAAAPIRDFDQLMQAKQSIGAQPTNVDVSAQEEQPDSPRIFRGRPVPVDNGEPSLVDDMKKGFARTGRIAADALSAFPLVAMDAGVGVRNTVSELQNLRRKLLSTEYSQTYPSYSSMYKETMDKSPLPPAGDTSHEVLGYEVPTEKIIDAVGQIAIGGKAIPNMSIKNPAPVVQKAATLADDAIQAGAKHNVPVYYDDVGGNVAKRVGTTSERVPVFGTGAGRATQQKAVNQATQKLTDKYMAGDNIPELVQKGLQDKLNGFRKAASKLYDDVQRATEGRGPVKTDAFDDALMKEMARQERLGTAANPEVVKVLEKYSSAPRGDFAFARELRSQLGDDIATFYKPGSAVGDKGAGEMQVIKEALEKDMGKYADDAGPTAREAWKRANAFYSKNVIPFKKAGLRQLVKTDEPAKAWRYLVQQSAGVERAEKMYRSLDTSGRRAVRSGLIQDAIESAKTPKGDVSPAKFAQYMEKHSNAVETFFKGRDLSEIKGFQNLMRHVERAGQYMENPPTGQRAIDVVAGGGAVAATINPAVLKLVAGISATAATVKVLFQTQRGRDTLIALSRMNPGTKAFDTAAKHLAAIVATQSKE